MKKQRYIAIGVIFAIVAIAAGSIFAIVGSNTPSPQPVSSSSPMATSSTTPVLTPSSHSVAGTATGSLAPPLAAVPRTSGSDRASVPVTLNYVGYNSAAKAVQGGGYAQTLDSGVCTLTLTLNTASVTATSASVANAANVSCGSLSIPLGKLSSGTWNATLSFQSPHYHGFSSPLTVKVP